MPLRSTSRVLALATALALGLVVALEAIDVKVEHQKTFDFSAVHTWGWNPKGAGDVIMARTQQDDPAAMKQQAEPLIVEAVTAEMMRLGLKQIASQPDVTLTYYLLLSTGASAQTMGQFLPATTAWGLPPFPQATQSLTVMNHGSLVLDLSAADVVVWRGVAQAQIKPDAAYSKREAAIRGAIKDLLKRYPPKPSKQ